MGLSEAEFLNEVYSCHSRDHDNGAWIQTAKSFLDESLYSQEGDYEKASYVLASSKEWSMEGLNALAYASFCFWHRPLEIPKTVFTCNPCNADWEANAQITELVCKEKLSQHDKKVWSDVTRSLKPACVALKALSLKEVSTKGKAWTFQADMLKALPQQLAEDPYLIEVSEKWPKHLAIDKNDKKAFTKVFPEDMLREISEKAAKIFCDTANELSPNDFGGVSSVRAYFPNEGKGNAGCYDYSGGKGFLVIPDTFHPYMQTLPAFLCFTAHEVLHMHQIRSVELIRSKSKSEKLLSSSPFDAEFLAKAGSFKARDFPCQTFGIRGEHRRDAELPTNAYLYRPKEFLTYQFGGALQKVLANKFETDFVESCFDTGHDEFAKAAGVKIEPDQPEKSNALVTRNVSSHSL